MTARPLGAQLSHMLRARGVEAIFGIPGVHNQELYRGIEEAGLTHILARHEQGAGFMADGYARATGRPGVAYVITGPGVCNILTPLGQAASDHVPVLTIASCLDDTVRLKGQLHQMGDQLGAARSVCDWAEEARDAATAYHLVDRALRDFRTADPRPKYIQVPISVLEAPAPPAGKDVHHGEDGLPPDPMNIAYTLEKLRAARRPLVVLGGGARDLAGDLLARLRARIPFASFTTYAGRGIVPPEDPLLFGAYLARPDSARIAASADLVIAIGTELSEVDLWRPRLGHAGPLIRVDRSAETLARDVGASFDIRAGAAAFAHSLLAALEGETLTSDWRPGDVAGARARWRSEVMAERPGIAPVCDALRDAVPDDAMIYSDMTQFAYAAKEVWPMARPGHWHHPFGFGTLGYALPAAIGGAVGRPGLPTLAIAGDYGLQYTIQELGTAVELGLPLPILVWDNGKLGEIEDSMVRAQIGPNAVVQSNPDFVALARAWGANGVKPASLGQLKSVIAKALQADRPTLVHMTASMLR